MLVNRFIDLIEDGKSMLHNVNLEIYNSDVASGLVTSASKGFIFLVEYSTSFRLMVKVVCI